VTDSVAQALTDLAIPRVAHFTPSKNLFHIVQDSQVRSSKELADLAPEYFDPTDVARFDRHPDMTCVSSTYPNGFYFAQAKVKPQFARFADWVCLMLNPNILTRPGVLFCPCNAARAGGRHAEPGAAALRRCFANPSLMGYTRGSGHHPQAATDQQAEALVPGPIPLSDVLSIVIPSVEAAGEDYARLDVGGLAPERLNWVVSPVMFDRDKLSAAIRNGHKIEETIWSPQWGTQ